jgi:hypothetical protein
VSTRPIAERRARITAWAVIGVIGWVGAVLVGAVLWNAEPRAAGFDWQLIVDAGARVAAGTSPYDPALLTGAPGLEAVDLFYSYPPPVAQAVALVSGVPLLVSLLALDALAVAGAAAVAGALARGRPGLRVADVVVPVVAVLPLLFPVTIALVFGNIDVLYPLVYGAVLIAATSGRGMASAAMGGMTLAVATVAKIQPVGLGLWLLVRGIHERRHRQPRRAWSVLAWAVGSGLLILVASIAMGGLGPWRDYATVLSTASTADVVVRANIGPAAQAALLLGLDESVARGLYVALAAGALVVTIAVAWYVDDALTSLAVAATASLVLLPVTWYHYPPALIPFALAAVLRGRGTDRDVLTLALVALAGIVASLAIALPVLVWVSVGLVLAAVAVGRPSPQPTGSPAPGIVASSAV